MAGTAEVQVAELLGGRNVSASGSSLINVLDAVGVGPANTALLATRPSLTLRPRGRTPRQGCSACRACGRPSLVGRGRLGARKPPRGVDGYEAGKGLAHTRDP